jgi:hypothetical protein
VVKEVRRELRIRQLTSELAQSSAELEETSSELFRTDLSLKAMDTLYTDMKKRLNRLLYLGWWPWVSKKTLGGLVARHN